jgi:hypothetical protein
VTLLAFERDRELVDGTVPAGLSVAFGSVDADEATEPVVRFGAERRNPGELLVATRGEGLWRRRPWPAADALFDAPAPADPAAVLVVHPDNERRAEVGGKLEAHGLAPVPAPRLRHDALLAVASVVFLEDGGFPEQAFAACAAGRLAIVQARGPLFGLQDGVDCFVADDDRAVVFAQMAARASEAFAAVRALGRIAAAPHRASDVYERLARDVELGIGPQRRARDVRA